MRYSIPEENIEKLEKKLTKIRNKCEKYGCEFKYERVGEHFEEKKIVDHDDVIGNVNGTPVYRSWPETIKFIDVEVEGKAAVNGWRFAASLEYTSKGNIISGVEGIEIPQKYYECAPWCEHCKTARDRKYSFIVFNEESGEFKQVGKACLMAFTRGLSAEAVAQYESFIKELEEASDSGYCGGWGRTYYNVNEFMKCVAETIRLYGYVKSGGETQSTASLAEDFYRVEHGMRLGYGSKEILAKYDNAVSKGFDVKREETEETVKAVIDWIVNNEKDDNYYHNLKVACSLEWCGGSTLGLLASAFPAHNRELEYQADRLEKERKAKEEGARSNHVGAVGKRVSFKAVEAKALTSWETMYGVTTIYKFVDGDGNVFTWKTSGWVNTDREIENVTGTVKEHKEYRGVKQTELTRCKIEYAEKKHAPANDEAWEAFSDAMDYLDGKVG